MGQTVTPPLPPGFLLNSSDNTPPLPPGFIVDSGTPQPGVTDNRTPTQVMLDQAKHVAMGIPQAITGIPSMISNTASAVSDLVTGKGADKAKALLKGAVQPITTSIQGAGALLAPESFPAPSQQEFESAAEGAGANAGGLLLGEGLSKIPAISKAPRSYISDRLVSSLLKPNKTAFDFGADPIQATLNSGATGATAQGLKDSIQSKLSQTEGVLTRAAELNAHKSANIGTILNSAIEPEISQAMLDGNKSMANRLNKIKDGRLADIQSRYGTLDLNPEQILAEKRNLKSEIKFTTDQTQVNINQAKLSIYRGMDHAFDAMIPNAAELNKHYSGLIEADKLIDSKLANIRKSNIIRKTDLPGETGLKMGAASILNPPKPPIQIDLTSPKPPRALLTDRNAIITPAPNTGIQDSSYVQGENAPTPPPTANPGYPVVGKESGYKPTQGKSTPTPAPAPTPPPKPGYPAAGKQSGYTPTQSNVSLATAADYLAAKEAGTSIEQYLNSKPKPKTPASTGGKK